MHTIAQLTRRPLQLTRAVVAGCCLLIGAQVGIQEASARPLDMCTAELTPGFLKERYVAGIGSSLKVIYGGGSVANRKVAIIFNGNGFASSSYDQLAEHLAHNGFVTAIARRPNSGNGGDAAYVIDAIEGTLDAVNIDPSDAGLQIALIGHSRGGPLAVKGATLNDTAPDPLPITAVVGLAAAADDDSWLNGRAAAAYLGIYGSQDEDLSGFGSPVKEAFRAYDQASHESSTTCNSPPCWQFSPVQDKTMVYLYGGDHAGMVGVSANFGLPPLPQGLDYVSASDQLCLVKAYVTSFLRWQLFGENQYEALLRDDWRPPSVANMVTTDADALGNPPGTPILVQLQISPRARKVINNFQIGAMPSATVGPVLVFHRPAGTLANAPHWVRHRTGYAEVRWQPAFSSRVAWAVPPGSQEGSSYTHFSIRLGLAQGTAAPWDNAVGVDRQVQIWLRDGNGLTSQHTVSLPYADVYVDNGDTRSMMATYRIPVEDIVGIDIDDVTSVELNMSTFDGGTLMVDSIEWHRD